MERHAILEMMGTLKLVGMRHAYDEVVADAVKRQHSAQRVVGDLLKAEIDEKQARSIRYQMTTAKLPLAKELADFDFAGTGINEGLVRDLGTGAFLEAQRNVVLVGGTGTGKTHLAIAMGRACVRGGARVRFYNTVDLVNQLEAEARAGAPGASPTTCRGSTSSSSTSLATCPSRSRRPVALPPRQQALRADLGGGDDQPCLRRVAHGLRRRQDDDRAPRPAHPPLRHRRDRQRELALQEPRSRLKPFPGPHPQVDPVGPQAPPTAVTACARGGARRRPRGPPVDYRDNPAAIRKGGQTCTPIRGQLPEPIDNGFSSTAPALAPIRRIAKSASAASFTNLKSGCLVSNDSFGRGLRRRPQI